MKRGGAVKVFAVWWLHEKSGQWVLESVQRDTLSAEIHRAQLTSEGFQPLAKTTVRWVKRPADVKR